MHLSDFRYDKPETTWYAYQRIWEAADCVSGRAVGPTMVPSYEHLLCEDFARIHPDALDFVIGKLSDRNPHVAAYAFKCLVRMKDVSRADLPEAIFRRKAPIKELGFGCKVRLTTLADFVEGFFADGYEEEDRPDLPSPVA
jgi:hypothetical protein